MGLLSQPPVQDLIRSLSQEAAAGRCSSASPPQVHHQDLIAGFHITSAETNFVDFCTLQMQRLHASDQLTSKASYQGSQILGASIRKGDVCLLVSGNPTQHDA